jgi:hypothetical protein
MIMHFSINYLFVEKIMNAHILTLFYFVLVEL